MDILSMLKLANVFNPSGLGPAPYDPTNPTGFSGEKMFPPGVTSPSFGNPSIQSPSQQPQGLDLNAAIQGLLSPRDEQFNNFAQMIQSMPQRSQYPPDLLHKLGGVLAGLGTGGPVGISNGAVLGYKSNIPEGLKVQSAIKDEKYNEALNDWANKLGPTEKISQMEQNRNVGNRATALGTLQRQQAQEKIDATEAQNKVKNEQNQQNIDIRKERADSYVKAKQFAMDHPDYKSFVDEDGNLVLYNPKDPTAKPIETGVKKLSEMEKIDLGVQGELKKIAARSEASKSLEDVKETNRETLEGIKQPNRIEVKKTTTAKSGSDKGLSPSAQKTARQNKAIEIINEHPELEPYFVKGGNKQPTGELTTAPDVKDPRYAGFAVAQRLLGASSDISLGNDNSSKLSPEPSSPTRELTRPEDPKIKAARSKVEAGYVLITDGKSFGQIKPADVDRLPKGWMVVK